MSVNGDFIEIYDGVLDQQVCRSLLQRFEASGQERPGLVGGGCYPELKHSRDICISGRPDWRDVEQTLNQAVFLRLLDYLRRYNHALIAPLMVQRNAGNGAFERLEQRHMTTMDDAELSRIASSVFRPGRINLQHYRADEGGYPYWHCELYPRAANAETLHRHLLWTLYLNDDFAEGETEFLYQARRVKPRTGSLLIAPTAFTHTHRGNRPQGGDKFIATSWILFQPAEKLYAGS
ncbi:2OG-Fe(II) oxygenase [Pseudoxanthomonas yeongjuensis]|uniref:2OG-Fe(II) oxygenase n=1 Tax=Pseudoxanthomonas yeongjuensis TaxID=377616 RepID=UPI001390F7EE|nr:2OG-Fe(II) oxygenase [Pseudoxanthomonas yeongjuensis]KAF1713810.1 2OG-Fe(II) oxygenase [Pseudoxanthomonas yeongjuensis]